MCSRPFDLSVFPSMSRAARAAPFTRSPRRPLPSISEIPFLRSCFPYLNLWLQRTRSDGQAFQSAQSADVSIRVIRGCLASSIFVSIRVNSWLVPENLKKFSLNPVEGISTSASMCITEVETADLKLAHFPGRSPLLVAALPSISLIPSARFTDAQIHRFRRNK